MSWNYRVMNKAGKLAIYSVYYNEAGKVEGYGIDPAFPLGETLEELKDCCEIYMEALKKPVLEYTE